MVAKPERERVIDEGPGGRSALRAPEQRRPGHRAPMGRPVASALLALLMILACASMQAVAQVDPAVPSLDGALAVCDGASDRLGGSAHEPMQYRQHGDAPAVCGLDAAEPQHNEEPAGSDAAVSGRLTLERMAPLSLPQRGLRDGPAAHKSQFLGPVALPRGPPQTRR